jgi:hypothetical protein
LDYTREVNARRSWWSKLFNQHLVVARRQNVNAGNLGFLVQLLGAKFGHLFDALKNL